MRFGWLSQFQFSDEQRQELLAMVGATEEEGAELLFRTSRAIRRCQADWNPQATPAELAKQLRALQRLAKQMVDVWPNDPECDRLLRHGLLDSPWLTRPTSAADSMLPVIVDIEVACARALEELGEIHGKIRPGRQANEDVQSLAGDIVQSWKDSWGERAPRGKMLKVMQYLLKVAETPGDARRALENVLPPVERKRGRVRRSRRAGAPQRETDFPG